MAFYTGVHGRPKENQGTDPTRFKIGFLSGLTPVFVFSRKLSPCCVVHHPHCHIFACHAFMSPHHLSHRLHLGLIGCCTGIHEMHFVQLYSLLQPEICTVQLRLGGTYIFDPSRPYNSFHSLNAHPSHNTAWFR
jgi:hypothetical protein